MARRYLFGPVTPRFSEQYISRERADGRSSADERRSVALKAPRENSLSEGKRSWRSCTRDAGHRTLTARLGKQQFDALDERAEKPRIEVSQPRRRRHRLDPLAAPRHPARLAFTAVLGRAMFALRRGIRTFRHALHQCGKRAVIARDEPSEHRDERGASNDEARLVGVHFG